ncbi:MAG: hypothetical protein C0493_01060 [Kytococcus sp.]|nr:hypothetical protein [Kytococcus sp.]
MFRVDPDVLRGHRVTRQERRHPSVDGADPAQNQYRLGAPWSKAQPAAVRSAVDIVERPRAAGWRAKPTSHGPGAAAGGFAPLMRLPLEELARLIRAVGLRHGGPAHALGVVALLHECGQVRLGHRAQSHRPTRQHRHDVGERPGRNAGGAVVVHPGQGVRSVAGPATD